jgi:hypothetical protein
MPSFEDGSEVCHAVLQPARFHLNSADSSSPQPLRPVFNNIAGGCPQSETPSSRFRSYLNAANGICIGFDCLGDHVIRDCRLYRNRQLGILRGVSNPQRVVLERNSEFENRGLPPDMTAVHASAKKKAERAGSRPEQDREAGDKQAKRGGGGGSLNVEELLSAMTTRERQKYMARC